MTKFPEFERFASAPGESREWQLRFAQCAAGKLPRNFRFRDGLLEFQQNPKKEPQTLRIKAATRAAEVRAFMLRNATFFTFEAYMARDSSTAVAAAVTTHPEQERFGPDDDCETDPDDPEDDEEMEERLRRSMKNAPRFIHEFEDAEPPPLPPQQQQQQQHQATKESMEDVITKLCAGNPQHTHAMALLRLGKFVHTKKDVSLVSFTPDGVRVRKAPPKVARRKSHAAARGKTTRGRRRKNQAKSDEEYNSEQSSDEDDKNDEKNPVVAVHNDDAQMMLGLWTARLEALRSS